MTIEFKIGNKYNLKNQPERLVYLGNNFSGNGHWHQFAKVNSPNDVWCEVKTTALEMFEETVKQKLTRDQAKKQRKKNRNG